MWVAVAVTASHVLGLTSKKRRRFFTPRQPCKHQLQSGILLAYPEAFSLPTANDMRHTYLQNQVLAKKNVCQYEGAQTSGERRTKLSPSTFRRSVVKVFYGAPCGNSELRTTRPRETTRRYRFGHNIGVVFIPGATILFASSFALRAADLLLLRGGTEPVSLLGPRFRGRQREKNHLSSRTPAGA